MQCDRAYMLFPAPIDPLYTGACRLRAAGPGVSCEYEWCCSEETLGKSRKRNDAITYYYCLRIPQLFTTTTMTTFPTSTNIFVLTTFIYVVSGLHRPNSQCVVCW